MIKKISGFLLTGLLVVSMAFTALADARADKCGENVNFVYDTTTNIITISGKGPMKDFGHEAPGQEQLWYNDYHNVMAEAVIDEGVTSIGKYTFEYHPALKTVSIPVSVKKIGDYAFFKSGVTKIKYAGSKADFAAITIGTGNDDIIEAMKGTSPKTVIEYGLKSLEGLAWGTGDDEAYVLTWNAVEGAAKYIVECGSTDDLKASVEDPEYDVKLIIKKTGTYEPVVYAVDSEGKAISDKVKAPAKLIEFESEDTKTETSKLPSDIKLAVSSAKYTGKKISPAVTVAGLTKGTDYTVTYKNNVKVGKASVVITGKGSYTGTVTKYFKIVPKTAKISKLTAGKKKLTVKLSAKPSKLGAVKYQIQYRIKGKSKWSSATATSQTKVITKLKKGKKYQIRVRAYKSVSGKNYYGGWSAVKTSGKIK